MLNPARVSCAVKMPTTASLASCGPRPTSVRSESQNAQMLMPCSESLVPCAASDQHGELGGEYRLKLGPGQRCHPSLAAAQFGRKERLRMRAARQPGSSARAPRR